MEDMKIQVCRCGHDVRDHWPALDGVRCGACRCKTWRPVKPKGK